MTAHRSRPVTLTVIGIVLLAVTGCSGSGGDGAITVARARVTAKERALTEASASATAAATAFCTASAA